MECYSSSIEGLPLASQDSRSIHLFTLPQWHIFMCRTRWIVAPHSSDEGSIPIADGCSRWMDAIKAFFWLAVAIGSGLLIAGLSG